AALVQYHADPQPAHPATQGLEAQRLLLPGGAQAEGAAIHHGAVLVQRFRPVGAVVTDGRTVDDGGGRGARAAEVIHQPGGEVHPAVVEGGLAGSGPAPPGEGLAGGIDEGGNRGQAVEGVQGFRRAPPGGQHPGGAPWVAGQDAEIEARRQQGRAQGLADKAAAAGNQYMVTHGSASGVSDLSIPARSWWRRTAPVRPGCGYRWPG